MQCPYCFSNSTVRATAKGTDCVIRLRICGNKMCSACFYTIESDIEKCKARELIDDMIKRKKQDRKNEQ